MAIVERPGSAAPRPPRVSALKIWLQRSEPLWLKSVALLQGARTSTVGPLENICVGQTLFTFCASRPTTRLARSTTQRTRHAVRRTGAIPTAYLVFHPPPRHKQFQAPSSRLRDASCCPSATRRRRQKHLWLSIQVSRKVRNNPPPPPAPSRRSLLRTFPPLPSSMQASGPLLTRKCWLGFLSTTMRQKRANE